MTIAAHDEPRAVARPGVRPLFLADWTEAVFLHWSLPAARVQPLVPFALDCWRGQALVSVVTFVQRRLRLAAGRLGWLTWPVAEHAFCNLRTYVRHRGEAGIHFLAEWIPNPLARVLGPALYGLPYRLGRVQLAHHGRDHAGAIAAADGCLAYRALPADVPALPSMPGSLDAFLIERYTAFTRHPSGRRLRFRITHAPWPLRPAGARIADDSLLRTAAPWWPGGGPIAAQVSAGVRAVAISAPQPLTRP